MIASIDKNSIDYFDFLDILQEALKTAPRKLFENIAHLILNKLQNQNIKLQQLILDIDEMHTLPVDDLEEFYDTILDSIDNITLFKKKLEPIKDTDTLLDSLYLQADKLHTSLVVYMDRMGQLEVRLLEESKKLA